MTDERLVETFVELADTLIDDFDVIDFLHLLTGRCVELLDVDAAGLLLANPAGELQLVASSDEQVRMLELFQLQADEGPCMDAFRGRREVGYIGLTAPDLTWPRFAAAATELGYHGMRALPMRLRSDVIGVLNVFWTAPGELGAGDLRAARAMVDVATIGLLQARSIRHHELVVEQLQSALSSRVVIEQAKGFVAERLGLEMDDAFAVLRGFARSNSRKLSEVAGAVVSRSESVRELFDNANPR